MAIAWYHDMLCGCPNGDLHAANADQTIVALSISQFEVIIGQGVGFSQVGCP